MKWTIESRCERRETRAFVGIDTVDLLAAKLVGLVGDRRMTVARRYLGEGAGRVTVTSGLRLGHGGLSHPVTLRPGSGVGIYLLDPTRRSESVGFSVDRRDETEEQVRARYDNPEEQWLGQRRDITLVELEGFPGEPHRYDRVRIETWNENGVGHELTVAFDDIDLVEEVGWQVKGDPVRERHLWDEFCDIHRLHFEHPDHPTTACKGRQATLAENLAVLAHLAQIKEQP